MRAQIEAIIARDGLSFSISEYSQDDVGVCRVKFRTEDGREHGVATMFPGGSASDLVAAMVDWDKRR